MKFYKSRDSITSILRKAGITPKDYNYYIDASKAPDGSLQWSLSETMIPTLEKNKRQLEALQSAAVARVKEDDKRAKASRQRKSMSLQAFAITLMRKNKTNQQIADLTKEHLGTDKPVSWFAWYRSMIQPGRRLEHVKSIDLSQFGIK